MGKHGGVYTITNEVTGEQYVGASKNTWARIGMHIGQLTEGHHDNPVLQAAWNTYGEHAFHFEVVEHIDGPSTELWKCEQTWIDKLHPAYNRKQQAVGRPKGFVNSEQHRERIKAALAKDPEGLKARQRAATEAARQVVTGTHKSEEERRRISETMVGRVYTDERRANISRGRKGVKTGPPSEEHRRHLSEANKGQDTSKAVEASAAARRGKALSEEHKRKVGEALKGKKRPPRTAEHSEKLRLAALERQARLRAERQHQQADAVE